MTSNRELLVQTLKSYGFSATKSRVLVFTALEKSEPLTMNQLIKKVGPEVNRASIYRIVSLFESLGIVQRLQIGWKYKLELSNAFQEHHHHLTCLECGEMTTFHEPKTLHALLETIAKKHAFRLQNHQLELQGICKKCQAKGV